MERDAVKKYRKELRFQEAFSRKRNVLCETLDKKTEKLTGKMLCMERGFIWSRDMDE